MTQDKTSLSKNYVLLAALSVAILTFAVYLPSLNNDFVNWDDPTYVYENPYIRSLNLEFFAWALSSPYFSNWHPLTMISYALNYAVWGLNPFGCHLTNVVFHAANTFLVFILTLRLIECGLTQNPKFVTRNFSLIAASVTALLFGIHPIHVESVAWISERKDVLYAFFYLLSVLAYVRYVTKTSTRLRSYAFSLVFFALSLMSKPMAVSLPVVLLILDLYPLKRLNKNKGTNAKQLLVEKLPFVLLSLLSSIITISAQQSYGALKPLEMTPLSMRFLVAMKAVLFYLAKMVAPINLAPIYPYPAQITIGYIASPFLVLMITLVCFSFFKRNLLFPTVWFYYLATLLPVLGIVQVSSSEAADRYSYLPGLGPFILAGIGIGCFIEKYSRYKWVIAAALTGLTLLTVNATINQIEVWRDSVALWTQEIRVYPDFYASYYNRGLAYTASGKNLDAIRDFSKAIELNPGYLDAYNNRGNVYFGLGHNQQALSDYDKALELNPGDSQVYTNRGNAYFGLGNYMAARRDHNKAIELDPNDPKAYNNRGSAYFKLGNYPQAIQDFEKAIELDPQFKEAHDNLGLAYSQIKRQ